MQTIYVYKMKHLKRLQLLYTMLANRSYTRLELLSSEKFTFTARQLNRDLKNLEVFYLRNDEEKLVKSKKGKGLKYCIEKSLQYLDKNQTKNQSLDDIENLCKKHKQIIKTRFYEINQLSDIQNVNRNIISIEEAVKKQKQILVDSYKYDATSESTEFQIEQTVITPISVTLHRGDFFLIGKSSTDLLTLSLSQIQSLKILENKKASAANLNTDLVELSSRFGVTKNYDDKIYNIKLRFSDNTGVYVRKFLWHETQKFKKVGINYEMTMTCGINRELVGWIFQWMSNVIIVEPVELKQKYNEVLKKIDKIKDNKVVINDNLFLEKKN